ncbi:tumor necrosis factor receptor superfamily member 17 [Colossoma macropomum]|uniref:tumor necrosis factor receptor superfamily member 17 n=1 Tax=Colossoma macropomum TaxID=42526 RepID=UPI001863AF05|nr:tumor necrosis factor receptor superfamily member 17 [Colossoma macropomum]
MILYLWLLFYITTVAESKCAKNYYYDGLLEDCRHCSIRCNSPPTICTTFCRPTSTSGNEARENQNVRTVLIVLFVFLGACTTLTLILQVIRRKACKHVPFAKAQKQDSSESERSSDATEQSEDADGSAAANGAADIEKGISPAHYNSNLPLPSTEEGTTVLVTTKTVQMYNCSTHYTQGVTSGIWRAGTV